MTYREALKEAKPYNQTVQGRAFTNLLEAKIQQMRERMDDCPKEDLGFIQEAIQEMKNLAADFNRPGLDKQPPAQQDTGSI